MLPSLREAAGRYSRFTRNARRLTRTVEVNTARKDLVMTASTISIGLAGGEDFTAAEQLRPSNALVMLLDAAADVDGAFGRRQNDLRAALDGAGTVVLLIGPRIATGLATQFGCWIRAKVGVDILPWAQPRQLEQGGEAYAAVRFFAGDLPDGAQQVARSRDGELAGVRFRGGAAKIVLAPADERLTAADVPALLEGLR
jgi:hypothetical protein